MLLTLVLSILLELACSKSYITGYQSHNHSYSHNHSTSHAHAPSQPHPQKANKRGAIIVLAPKDSSNYQTLEKGIVNRNRSIQEYLWQKLLETAAQTGEALPDIVIFHENDIPSELQKKVKEDTPDLRIIFRKIKNFNLAKYDNKTGKFKLNYAKCPEGYRSEITPVGYKDMCRFWSLGFLDYVREYDWVFRFDDDCEISEILDASMFSSLFNPDVFISAPGWQPLNRQRFDLVDLTQKTQGVVVQGLLSFTQDFVNRYSPEAKGKVIHSMMAPYTNAMYINLKWLRAGEQFERKQHKSSSTVSKQIYQAHLILEFLKAVDESNCIYTNRWGDMPIWGAALAVVEHDIAFMQLPYYHESHHLIIKTVSVSGFYRKDIPLMLVWPDNINKTIGARITEDTPPLMYPHWETEDKSAIDR